MSSFERPAGWYGIMMLEGWRLLDQGWRKFDSDGKIIAMWGGPTWERDSKEAEEFCDGQPQAPAFVCV